MSSAEMQGKLWGANPEGWATAQERQHSPLFEVMLDAAQVVTGSRVLDAGCGSGYASKLAAQRGAQVSGIDAAAGMITYAKERLPEGDFRVGDIQSLPYENDSFNAVIAPNSVQYSADRVATLKGFSRVCQAGGRVVAALFSTPERVAYTPIFSAARDVMPEPPPGKGPFELSKPGVLESLFVEAGLNIIDSGEVNCPFIYSDFEQFWFANSSAGPFQGLMLTVEEDIVKEAMRQAAEEFKKADGSIEIAPNYFKYIVAAI